ncbi:hypothetical protein C6496_22800 [Candidatus Poribacteria bacterium]|nr:MAG: hypothetical protein C6496_22800 [Candidatus Poribacteria bacterium]
MQLGLATVFDITIAKKMGFLYTIYGLVENQATLYVGQTRGWTGALGRLAQHLSDSDANTYLQRLSDVYEYHEVPLEKVDFAAMKFTSREEFQIDDQEYRIAVENWVQARLKNWIREKNLSIFVASRTRSSTYSQLPYVKEEATRIANALEPWILECHRIS